MKRSIKRFGGGMRFHPFAVFVMASAVFLTSCSQRKNAELSREIAALRADVDLLRTKLEGPKDGVGFSHEKISGIIADSLMRYRSKQAGSGIRIQQEDMSFQALKLDIRALAKRVDNLNGMNEKAQTAGIGTGDMARIKKMIESEIDALHKKKQNALSGPIAPDHEWIGTKLRFRTANGEWGKSVDLKGETGPSGDNASIGGPEKFGEWKIYTVNPAQTLFMPKEKQTAAGIVIGTIHAGRNGRGVLCGETESVKVKTSAHWKDFGSNQNLFITDNSFMFPVKPRGGWSITASQWEGSVSATVYWIPFR